MYVRKNIREFIDKMPKEKTFPKHWRRFINKLNEDHSLIIKHGNEYECLNCKKYFKSEIEAGQMEFCPFCNNRYLVRNGNLKNYHTKYNVAFLDNINNKLVIRIAEVRRIYDYKTRELIDDIAEYARIIPELEIELVNDRYCNFLGYYESVYHSSKIRKWRVYSGRYNFYLYYDDLYMDNLEQIVKGTIYEYAPIRVAMEYKKLYKTAPEILEILKKAKYPSFELLIKAELYNLGINTPEEYDKKGNFETRFGVPKDYYGFMKKHDISHKELLMLGILKRKNIKIIRNMLEFFNNNEGNFNSIKNDVDFFKLVEYSKKQKSCWNLYSYLDYIENMKTMEVPLTKKILFPENLAEAHDESVRKIEVINSKRLQDNIKKRYKELENKIYINDKYIIRPARSVEDMKDEAKQQNNCVYRVYSEKYANGSTDIYFLRDKKNPKKSLVTVEVNKNKIRQQFQKYNREVTKEQDNFLKLWEKNVIQKAA